MTLNKHKATEDDTTTETTPLMTQRRNAHLLLERKAFWLSALMFAQVFTGMDETLQTTAAVKIGNEFEALDHISWLGTGFFVGVVTAYLFWTTIGEIWGRKNALVGMLTSCVIGVTLGGFASSMPILTIARAFQGLGAGGLVSVVTIVIADTFLDMKQRGFYEALRSGIFALSSISGPILGGWISDSTDWRWIYRFQIPGLAISLVVVIIYFPNIQPHMSGVTRWQALRRRNLRGMFFVIVATVSMYVGFDNGSNFAWTQISAYGCLGATVVFYAMFAITEYFHPEPFIPRLVLKNRSLLMALFINLFSFANGLGALYYIPILYQALRKTTARGAGILMIPSFLGSMFILLAAQIGMDRLGGFKRIMVVATLIATIAAAIYAGLARIAPMQIYGQSVALLLWFAGYQTTVWGSIMSINCHTASDQDTSPAFRSLFLFRGTGTGLGISTYSAIVQTILAAKLRHLDPPVSEELARHLRQSLQYLHKLDPAREAIVRAFYGRAISYSFMYGVGMLSTCIIWTSLTVGKPMAGYEEIDKDPDTHSRTGSHGYGTVSTQESNGSGKGCDNA